MPTAPRNLDELRAIPAPLDQAAAAGRYIHTGLLKLAEARTVRDDAIRAALADNGLTTVARACGVSTSHVKAVRKAAR